MSDDPIFCARCFKELPAMPSNSQEISCPSCGADIVCEETDVLTHVQWVAKCGEVNDDLNAAETDGLIIRKEKP